MLVNHLTPLAGLLAIFAGWLVYAISMRQVDALKMANGQLFRNTTKMPLEKTSEFSVSEMVATGAIMYLLAMLAMNVVRPIKLDDFYGMLVSFGLVVVLAASVILFWIDLRVKKLPNTVIYTFGFFSFAAWIAAAIISQNYVFIMYLGMGLVMGLLYYGIFWFFFPKGMGFGDVRMAGLLGAAVMFIAPGGLMVLLVGPWFMAMIGEGLKQLLVPSFRKKAFAFGPWIVLGFLLAVFQGEAISDFVFSLF